MSILSTIKKGTLAIKTASGYVKMLPRTLASLVSMDDGTSVENAINTINTNLSDINANCVVESGSIVKPVINGSIEWHYKKWSNGEIEMWTKHSSWIAESNDTYTEFPLPFSLPNAEYVVIFSKEAYSANPVNFTKAQFITTNKTTENFTIYCYREGTVSVRLNIVIKIYYSPS